MVKGELNLRLRLSLQQHPDLKCPREHLHATILSICCKLRSYCSPGIIETAAGKVT